MMLDVKKDEYYMKHALRLAEKGRGFVSPNPIVGAVIVKGKKIIAEGFHSVFGGAHAEVVAFENARKKKKSLRGATLYVTLEPCCHEAKKTPPCVPQIIASGISRVVVAHQDMNPYVDGRGVAQLKKAGLEVVVGCLEENAHEQNHYFFYGQLQKIPYVSLKIASTLDGRIAVASGDSRWITGKTSREYVKKMRDLYDAILVGKNTVILDDPHLAGKTTEPIRIVLDHRLETRLNSEIFRTGRAIVITTKQAPKNKVTALEKRNIRVIIMTRSYNLHAILEELYNCGVNSILVEGGGQIFGSFIRENAYNDIYWFTAPRILGDSARPSVSGLITTKMADSVDLHPHTVKKLGDDVLQILTNQAHR